MRITVLVGLIVIAGSVTAGPARANTLTFDTNSCTPACTDGDNISQGYGDAPGVDVRYSMYPGDGNNLAFWSTGFGDLKNVAWSNSFDGTAPAEIFLKPTPGNLITLNGFDLAAYYFPDPCLASDAPPTCHRSPDGAQWFNTKFTILDGNDNILDNLASLDLSADVGHYHYGKSWSSTSGIKIQYGLDADNIGIDNIDFYVGGDDDRFADPVPEPASLTLLSGALAAIGLALCRRRRVV
jgi:PEP-CTERM motif-containing protein